MKKDNKDKKVESDDQPMIFLPPVRDSCRSRNSSSKSYFFHMQRLVDDITMKKMKTISSLVSPTEEYIHPIPDDNDTNYSSSCQDKLEHDLKSLLLSNCILKIMFCLDENSDVKPAVNNLLETGKEYNFMENAVELCLKTVEYNGSPKNCETIINRLLETDCMADRNLIRAYLIAKRRLPDSECLENLSYKLGNYDNAPCNRLFYILNEKRGAPMKERLLNWASTEDVFQRECLEEISIENAETMTKNERSRYMERVSTNIDRYCSNDAGFDIKFYI